jgi:hypothetical protein
MTATPQTPAARPPGRIWYFVAVLVATAGWIGMVVVLAAGLAGSAERMTRVVVPGQAELDLQQPGNYTIFHEYQSTIGNRVYNVESVSGLNVSVRAKAGGPPLPLRSGVSSQYNYSGHAGRSLFNFEIREPGSYILSAAYDDGRKEPQTVLAIDRGFVGSLVVTILGALALALGGMATAITMFIVVFVKRRRARRSAAPA